MTDKTWKEWKVIQIPFVANGGATWTDDAHKGTWISFDDAEIAEISFKHVGLA